MGNNVPTVDETNMNSDLGMLSQLSSKNINSQLLRRNANGGSNGNIFSRRAHPIVNMKLFNLPSSYKVATPQSNSSKKIST
jgi:hypothetical protein